MAIGAIRGYHDWLLFIPPLANSTVFMPQLKYRRIKKTTLRPVG